MNVSGVIINKIPAITKAIEPISNKRIFALLKGISTFVIEAFNNGCGVCVADRLLLYYIIRCNTTKKIIVDRSTKYYYTFSIAVSTTGITIYLISVIFFISLPAPLVPLGLSADVLAIEATSIVRY